jgi:hypothetical protein
VDDILAGGFDVVGSQVHCLGITDLGCSKALRRQLVLKGADLVGADGYRRDAFAGRLGNEIVQLDGGSNGPTGYLRAVFQQRRRLQRSPLRLRIYSNETVATSGSASVTDAVSPTPCLPVSVPIDRTSPVIL